MIVTTAAVHIEVGAGAVVGSVGYKNLPHLSRKMAVRRKAIWDIEARDSLISALACSEADVFPLRYTLRVAIRGERQLRAGVVR